MPNGLDRPKPLAEQIHDELARQVTAGEFPAGVPLPSVSDLAARFHVSRGTAARALAWLETDGLATSTTRGYIARPGRVTAGPQQRLAFTRFPAAERVRVLDAGLVPAPAYVVPLLDLEPVRTDGLTPVIRREEVHYEPDGTPLMLMVRWYPPEFAGPVPELSGKDPIGEPGGPVKLIQARTGRTVIRGRQARETRRARDDGREGPHLNLLPGDPVLAEVFMWFDADGCLEYGEYVLIEGRVTENEYAA